jgi:hypothetical protein
MLPLHKSKKNVYVSEPCYSRLHSERSKTEMNVELRDNFLFSIEGSYRIWHWCANDKQGSTMALTVANTKV